MLRAHMHFFIWSWHRAPGGGISIPICTKGIEAQRDELAREPCQDCKPRSALSGNPCSSCCASLAAPTWKLPTETFPLSPPPPPLSGSPAPNHLQVTIAMLPTSQLLFYGFHKQTLIPVDPEGCPPFVDEKLRHRGMKWLLKASQK